MRTFSQNITKLGLGLFAVSAVVFAGVHTTSAASGGPSVPATPTAPVAPSASSNQSTTQAQYNFVAADGDSLTLLARRAVDQYAKEQKLTLSPAARVYAETNIVQEFGSRFLNLGENVSIPRSLVEKYVKSSQSLTADDSAAWNVYAVTVDFPSSLATPAPTPVTPNQQTNQPAQPQSNDQNKDDQSNNSDKKSSTPWYWWPIGIATLAGLYYILGGKPSKDETSTTKK